MTNDVMLIVMVQLHGGPDHRITYNVLQLLLIPLFQSIELDMSIAGTTTPYYSWTNPGERIMSYLV